jgi:Cu2+-exporting ATPase
MKTSVIEVHDMLSVLSVDEVEKRIGEVPGVESVTVNFAAGNATVRYDETRLEIADVKSTVRQRGYQPAAPTTPAPAESKAAPAAAPAPAGDAPPGKAASSATPESPPPEPPVAPEPTPASTPGAPGAPKPPETSAAAPADPAPDEKPDKAAPDKS